MTLTTTLSLSRLTLRAEATVPCLLMTNLDKLETKDAKEEYDSDTSDTGSDSGLGEE